MKCKAANLGRRVRAAFVTALLLPYLLVQSIAAGVMPVVTDDGISFVICSGDRIAVTRISGASADSPGEGVPHADGGACPWAIAHAPASIPDTPVGAITSTIARTFEAVEAHHAKPYSHGALSPPARAPPALA